MEDYELLQGLKLHDEMCYNQIVKKYTKYVVAVVSKVAGNQLNTHEKEEISWEVFVKTWEQAEKIQLENNNLKNYLGVVARNLTINIIRDKGKDLEKSLKLEYISCKSAEEEFVIRDTLKRVGKFISRTKEPDKEIFIRRYFYLEKVRDIAVHLNMNEKAISARIARLRKKLEDALEKGEC